VYVQIAHSIHFFMKKRQKIILAIGFAILIASIFLSQLLANQSGKGQPDDQGKGVAKARPVATRQVEVRDVQAFIDITGRLQAEDKIDIYAEVTGVLLPTRTDFKVGNQFSRGALLLRIDDSEARQSLRSAKSNFINTLASVIPDLEIDYPQASEQWNRYLLELNEDEALPPLPKTSSQRIKLFLTARQVYTQYYDILQAEERLDKYRLYAPFDGTLTEASINKGTLVRSGQKLGAFIRSGVYELETAVSTGELPYVNIGDTVMLTTLGMQQEYEGEIVRINDQVETNTQTVRLFVRVADPDLKAGMYMEGRIKGRLFEQASELRRDVLVNNSQVFVMEDSTAVLRQVQPLKTSDTTAIVRGLSEGTTVIMENNLSSFEGTRVVSEESQNEMD
jgi:multidrug efflux pump subunit AcrA (membrane-fusion protein)